MTQQLVLSIRNLRPADQSALQILLRFVGKGPDAEWRLSTQDDGDLVLHGLDDQTWPAPLDDPDAPPVVWVVDAGQQAPWSDSPYLTRPLQLDPVAALLRQREAALSAAAAASAEPAATLLLPGLLDEAVAPATARPTPVPAARSAPTPTAALRPPAPALPARPPAVPVPVGVTYRMSKWPAAAVLRGQPKLTRLLGFLSQRPMDTAELAMLSGLDEPLCCELLGVLHAHGLLARVDAAPAEPPADVAPARRSRPGPLTERATDTSKARTASADRSAAPSAGLSLLRRLRSKLGI